MLAFSREPGFQCWVNFGPEPVEFLGGHRPNLQQRTGRRIPPRGHALGCGCTDRSSVDSPRKSVPGTVLTPWPAPRPEHSPYGLRMSALIITESLFGNTLAVAEAIAQGIAEVDGPGNVPGAVHASDAPIDLPSTVDLVVIGAPTHTLSLPDVSSRAAAILEGGRSSAIGIREWIQIVHLLPGTRVATLTPRLTPNPRWGVPPLS